MEEGITLVVRWVRTLKFAAVGIAVAAMAGPAILFADDLSRTALLESAGYIVEGRKFGVAVGDDRRAAIRRLTRGSQIRRHETLNGGTCLMREYDTGVTVDVFLDSSWRNGSICLASRNGRIEEIAWLFGSP
jgi:hypothetical protein